MKAITKQKPFEKIKEYLERYDKIYIIGCGTCTTMCHTGGREEVLSMKDKLTQMGKMVTGWMIIPTACDELTKEALKEEAERIQKAEAILAMTCAFGVQTIASYSEKPIFPALDTLFMGIEDPSKPGYFSEVCQQCGDCILAETGGICPIASCPKGLLNGPCGGTNNGKCEVDPEKDCAWTLIYQRLEKQGRLDLIRKYFPPRNFQAVGSPKKIHIQQEISYG